MEARAGKRKPVAEVHVVDPWASFRVDFESVLDTRADGLNPLIGGELWVNPKAGANNVRKEHRGFTLCSGLRGRRADLSVEECSLTLVGLFSVVFRDVKDVGRLRDALLHMEEAPPIPPAAAAPDLPVAGECEGRSKRRHSPERSLDQEGTEDDERGSKFQAVGRLDDPDASAEEEDPAPVDLPGTRRRIIGKQPPHGLVRLLGRPCA